MKRLLIAGFGDIARRALPELEQRFDLVPLGRRFGFDLDRPETLELAAADALLYCAPPPNAGETDPRTTNLLAALGKNGVLPARVVYVSTSRVYGDCAGARIDEARPPRPETPRARRRLDAERRIHAWCRQRSVACIILRVPGIYAADRLPLERLRACIPVLRPEDDVYTSHIHAEDLARAVARALENDAPAGVYNTCDDSEIKLGDWMDLVADRFGLPRPPRVSRTSLRERVSAQLLSFMQESRRLDNRRLKELLRFRLRYPTVEQGLAYEHAAGIH